MTIAEELIQRGRVEARAELLIKLLAHKFGELPSDYLARIADASDEQREHYAVRVVTVDSLAKVFADD